VRRRRSGRRAADHGSLSKRSLDVPDLVARAEGGEARAVARLISLVEDASPALREVMALLAPRAGHARVVGLTGSPGVGKSTSTSALVSAYRRRGMRVGVLAVDPSSPFSGGALLGDRRTDEGWRVPILRTVASKGEGADEVVDAIEAHGDYLAASGRLAARRVKRAADEVEGIALTSLRVDLRSSGELDRLAARVVEGSLDPYAAADELVQGLS
jgi:putative protein kinase ArgK-like GTPase of G3E family